MVGSAGADNNSKPAPPKNKTSNAKKNGKFKSYEKKRIGCEPEPRKPWWLVQGGLCGGK